LIRKGFAWRRADCVIPFQSRGLIWCRVAGIIVVLVGGLYLILSFINTRYFHVQIDIFPVLLVTGGHPFEHDPFLEVFTSQPDFIVHEVVQPEAQKWFAPEKVGQYDVMVWYDMYKDISDEAKANLKKLLKEKGKPVLAMHHVLAGYARWDEMGKILGARYKFTGPEEGRSTFKHDQEMKIKIADPKHPVTRYMDNFDLHDETYGNVKVADGVKTLLTTNHPESMKQIAWTHKYGKSQIVYLQSGHDSKTYSNPHFRQFVAQSIRWLAGALPDPSEEGFKPIFNGENFDGWTIKGDPKGFKVVDGVVRSDIPRIGHYIHTNKVYDDFILRIEWRISKNGNSGVFVRSTAGAEPWNMGSEVQISNEPRDDIHCTGTLYGDVAVNPRPNEAADKWHEFEIHCRGPYYKVYADNVPVIDVDSRMIPALKVKPDKGFIGMQDAHVDKGGYVEYRNIRVKELPPVKAEKAEADWHLGMQAWTFNHLTLYETIDMAKKLGIKYLEIYPGQKLSKDEPKGATSVDMPWQQAYAVKQKADEAGVDIAGLGVIKFTKDKKESQKIFDFAMLMGIDVINAEPEPDAFAVVDQLANKYGIKVAIHNHPKPSRYWDPNYVQGKISNCSKMIGVCADTGHWMRSGVNPVETLKMLEGRINSLHFKDLNKMGVHEARDVVWGTGVGDAKAMLAELKRQGFKGLISVEYEHKSDKLEEEVAGCVKAFRKMADSLGVKAD